MTSATAFLPLALERLGAQLPPYFELLRRIDAEVGVLRRDGVLSKSGATVRYDDLTDTQRRLVSDYRLVQYDLSLGARYSLASMWYQPDETG